MDNVNMLLEPIRASLHQVGEFLPRVLLAAVILVVGWLIAKGARYAVAKGLRAINFNVVTQKAGVDKFLQQGGGEFDTTAVLAVLFYWLVILAALMVAFNSMGLTYVTDLIGRIVLFVPKVMVAVLIIAFGTYFAGFIGVALTTYCKNVGIGESEMLGRFARYAIMVFVILIALDQLGLGDIIRQTFLIVIAAVALGLALAFGLGGQKRAAAFLDRWSRQRDEELQGGAGSAAGLASVPQRNSRSVPRSRPMTDPITAVWRGRSYPRGATWDGEGVNFALFSEHADKVELCFFDASGRREVQRIRIRERTDFVWHCYLPEARPGMLYGYRVHGPYRPERGHRFNPHKLLLDPYARNIVGTARWSDALFGYTIGSARGDLSFDRRDSASGMPKCKIIDPAFTWGDDRHPGVAWQDTVIYETHVRGFTRLHPEVPPACAAPTRRSPPRRSSTT